MKKDEFDQAFERYLKDRFKPFRDKERPADYGRDLSPNQEKTHFRRSVLDRAVAVGRLIAAVTVNRKDRELDLVLLSSKDGSLVPEPDQRLRQGHGLRPHRPDGRAVRDAVDGVVAEGRSPRLLRPDRERNDR
jgi:hypothetical protein